MCKDLIVADINNIVEEIQYKGALNTDIKKQEIGKLF